MALLKEDGSLDIESINSLPFEEYMDAMGDLTEAQTEEYLSKLPVNESKEPVRMVEVDYSLEEDMARNGTVLMDDVLNKLRNM
ncbi:MAG: hypothetical protein LIP02_14615 [Bacteroidales bacterium]|nr:hypothetical protein [Bacteroidales bacterium]